MLKKKQKNIATKMFLNLNLTVPFSLYVKEYSIKILHSKLKSNRPGLIKRITQVHYTNMFLNTSKFVTNIGLFRTNQVTIKSSQIYEQSIIF